MREAVVEQGAQLLKTSYAGFMTSSPEKSLDQGRAALSAATEMPCTLGSAESENGRTELFVHRFTVPGTTRWTDSANILETLGSDPLGNRHETSVSGPNATFLFAVHRAALEPAATARRGFFHNGKLHQVITTKQRSAGEVRMMGTIRDQSGAAACEFNLGFDPADPSGIPNRIEFRARSFLRLTFEYEPGVTEAQAALPWLIEEERA
jgi:hypothetical protein